MMEGPDGWQEVLQLSDPQMEVLRQIVNKVQLSKQLTRGEAGILVEQIRRAVERIREGL